MAVQQKYIYPPLTLQGLEALYANPAIETGYSTVTNHASKYNIKYDRVVSDILELPYNYAELKINPNELCTSISIFNIIDRLNYNFIYLNTRSVLASNKLPTYYKGYYSCDSLFSKLPYFYENTPPLSAAQLPNLGFVNGEYKADPNAPPLSGVEKGENLNSIVTGVWVRDNSLIDTTSTATTGENFHLGFLCSPTSMNVVKMSSNPENKTVNYGGDGLVNGSKGWVVIDKYELIQDVPSAQNKLKYSNITKVKADDLKNIYVLDRGVDTDGVGNISSSSRRSVIYKYDMSGFLELDNSKSIQKNKRILTQTLGDLNTSTNVSDVIDPVSFTVDSDYNIIVYDEHDYTFKVYDKNINFVNKYPKRNTFFLGASGTQKKYLGISDIHYDNETDNLYVLTPTGYIFVFDKTFKLVDRIVITKENSNQSQILTPLDLSQKYFENPYPGASKYEYFHHMEFSKNEPNAFYILTNNRLIKKFKTRLEKNIGVYDLLKNNIGLPTQQGTLVTYRANLKFISILQEANVVLKQLVNSENETVNIVDTDRTYLYDQLYMYTDFVDVKNSNIATSKLNTNYILSFQEKINTRSNLVVKDYSIYDISDITSISHKEYASDIVYNKLMHKILSNHLKMLELVSYRLTAKYTSTGQLVFDKREYIEEDIHRNNIFKVTQDYYVGINEYVSTGVVNRLIQNIINIQEQLVKTLNIVPTNKWPNSDSTAKVEPYLYTAGGEFNDINNLNYIGYYYLREQTGGDIYVSGRNDTDGEVINGTSLPSTNRYLVANSD